MTGSVSSTLVASCPPDAEAELDGSDDSADSDCPDDCRSADPASEPGVPHAPTVNTNAIGIRHVSIRLNVLDDVRLPADDFFIMQLSLGLFRYAATDARPSG